jgi:putative ABC transport system ATP-binding protein
MTSFRRENIGYVFQFFNLLQDLTVIENIMLIQELSGGRDETRARQLLELVGLSGEVDRFPAEISGGQQQRVAIARSLAKSPRLLLGDELTGNLDSKTSAMVMEVLIKACEAEGITCIFVTHDESLVEYATRAIRLDSGRVMSDSTIE